MTAHKTYFPVANLDVIRRRLAALIKETNKAIVDICSDYNQDPEKYRADAINWGDLSCRGAALTIDDYGDVGFQIRVEELAPDCAVFQLELQHRLNSMGWGIIEVLMEW